LLEHRSDPSASRSFVTRVHAPLMTTIIAEDASNPSATPPTIESTASANIDLNDPIRGSEEREAAVICVASSPTIIARLSEPEGRVHDAPRRMSPTRHIKPTSRTRTVTASVVRDAMNNEHVITTTPAYPCAEVSRMYAWWLPGVEPAVNHETVSCDVPSGV